MVEITYQMVLSTLQTVGLLVGIFYYITIMRNAQRNQRMAHESRQIQLLMQFSNTRSEAGARRGLELLNMEWEDYDDYERKYGSDINPDNYSKRMIQWGRLNTMGLLIRRGLIERDLLFEYSSAGVMQHWAKFKDVIYEMRKRYNLPMYGLDFEYLAEENKKYYLEKGFDPIVPDTYIRYVPDEQ